MREKVIWEMWKRFREDQKDKEVQFSFREWLMMQILESIWDINEDR